MRHTWAFSMLNPKSLVLSSCCEHCHFGSFLGYPFPAFSVKKKQLDLSGSWSNSLHLTGKPIIDTNRSGQ
jgi:hypothetical protein